MITKLTDAQRLMLSAAAQRDDRILAPPANLKGGTAQSVAAKLIAGGLVKEVKAKAGAAAWRRDAETGQAFALQLTAAGLKAAAIDDGSVASTAPEAKAANEGVAASNPCSASAPRDGSKISQVIGLLRRDDDATLDEVVAATGWLPHTSRAALTGLRKRGYTVEKRLIADVRRSYIIAATPQASAT